MNLIAVLIGAYALFFAALVLPISLNAKRLTARWLTLGSWAIAIAVFSWNAALTSAFTALRGALADSPVAVNKALAAVGNLREHDAIAWIVLGVAVLGTLRIAEIAFLCRTLTDIDPLSDGDPISASGQKPAPKKGAQNKAHRQKNQDHGA